MKFLSIIRQISPEYLACLIFWMLLLSLSSIFFDSIQKSSNINPWFLNLLCVFLITSIIGMNWITKRIQEKYATIVRVFSSVFFTFSAYTYLGYIIDGVNPSHLYWEKILARIDYYIFGNYPVLYLEIIRSPLLNEYFQIIYSTFYLLPLVLGGVLFFEKRYKELAFCTFGVVFCFLLSYIGYLLIPAMAVEFNQDIAHHFKSSIEWKWIGKWINESIKAGEKMTKDCFPSGHTAVPVLLLYYAMKYKKKLLWFYIPVVISIVFSTVYLRYHYCIDVIAGLVLTCVVIWLAPIIFRFWEKSPQKNSQKEKIY